MMRSPIQMSGMMVMVVMMAMTVLHWRLGLHFQALFENLIVHRIVEQFDKVFVVVEKQGGRFDENVV